MIDRTISHYRVLETLGGGGMGVVYKARDTRLGREVAIKLLPPEVSADADRLRRFEKEARAASSLNHPNIVTIHEIERIDSTSFIVMELVAGKTLREVVSEGVLPVRRLLTIAVQIAEGLARAHSAGIVHRDLKPDNVMVTKDGLVKILDFGLAKLAHPEQDGGGPTQGPTVSGGTSPGVVMGTVGYMSPEQASGHPVDFRSDQFSFGSVLYEMATGKSPFRRATAAQTLAAVIQDEPEPVAAVNPKVPPPLRWIIERCLAKEARERYSSTEDLARDLAGVRDHLSEAFPGEAVAAAAQRPSRRIHSIGIAVSIVVALLALGGLWLSRRANPTASKSTRWEQITRFTDSATSPALSPDGRMLAFIRGPDTFSGPGQIYVKLLPSGDPVQLTDDSLNKMSPVFSPEESRIAYTAQPWDTWIVPVIGGKPRLWLPNASGLIWIDREHVLFSEVKKGVHMAIVTSTESRVESRDVYVPSSENGMAHRSYLSPDRKSVLTAEMDWGSWLPCRLLPFDGSSAGKLVGPEGSRCTSAAWSPDGRWMYLTVDVGDGFHIWRQRFPDGKPEQVTSGATEEDGVAMAPDGRSFVTSVGTVQSSVWMHDERGEHQLSFEGYSSFGWPGPSRSYLSADGRKLYYLSRQQGATLDNRELWSVDTVAKATERLLPEFTMIDFDVSADGKSVVFTTRAPDGKYEIWLASLERRSLSRRLSVSSSPERRPVFGPAGDIFFEILDPAKGAVYRMKEDGTEVQRVRPDAGDVVLRSVSPDGGWLALSINIDVGTWGRTDAYPIQGGSPVHVCEGCRSVNWSPDGRHLYLSFVGTGFSTDTGRTFALPIPMGRALPNLPAAGINSAEEAAALPGVTIIPHGNISPGRDPSVYAFPKMTAQRNLYRVPITD